MRKPTVIAAAIAAVACTGLFAGPASARTAPRPPAVKPFTVTVKADCGGLEVTVHDNTVAHLNFDAWGKSDRTWNVDLNRVGWIYFESDELTPGQTYQLNGMNGGGSGWNQMQAGFIAYTNASDPFLDPNVDQVTWLWQSPDVSQPCG